MVQWVTTVELATFYWERAHGQMAASERLQWRRALAGEYRELLGYNVGALRRVFSRNDTLGGALEDALQNERAG